MHIVISDSLIPTRILASTDRDSEHWKRLLKYSSATPQLLGCQQVYTMCPNIATPLSTVSQFKPIAVEGIWNLTFQRDVLSLAPESTWGKTAKSGSFLSLGTHPFLYGQVYIQWYFNIVPIIIPTIQTLCQSLPSSDFQTIATYLPRSQI